MKEIFDKYVETSFEGFNQAKFKIKQFELNYFTYFNSLNCKEVLDIGVGRGEMLSCMQNWGLNYHGIDISPSTIKFCKDLNLNCEIVEDSTDWLLKNTNKFSLITCLDVLEHIPRDNVINFLKAIRCSLKPGGLVIIQVPNLQSPFGYLHHFNDFTHVSGFVEHSLAQVLQTSGFNKFEFKGFEEIYERNLKAFIKKILRWILRKGIRICRKININPNPAILDPVIYVVAYK